MPKQETNQAPDPCPLVLLLHYIQTHYLITDIKMMCYVFLPIIDLYDIDDVLYWFKYIYIYIFSYVSLKLTYVAQRQLTCRTIY